MNFFSTIQRWLSDLFHTRSLKRGKIGIFIFGMLVFAGVLAYTPHAFADPPSSPYTPGETLTPSCSPGALNCTVTPPLGATTTLTNGSLLFIGNTSGTVYENNPNLFWDNVNARLGIGTVTPSSTLSVAGGAFISGNVTSTNLTISGISGSTQCLRVNAAGVVSGTGSDCVSTTTGNWAGTWQGVNSSTFYLATNPSNFISLGSLSATGTGLTYNTSTGVFSWTNDAGYITTSSISINGVQGNVFTGLATSTGIASYNVTSANPYISVSTTTNGATLTFSTTSFGSAAFRPLTDFLASSTAYLATATGNWAGTWQTLNPSDFLTSSTIYLSTTTGNWIGTWQGANSSTFYLATNPNHYVATSSLGTVVSYNYTDFLTSSTMDG